MDKDNYDCEEQSKALNIRKNRVRERREFLQYLAVTAASFGILGQVSAKEDEPVRTIRLTSADIDTLDEAIVEFYDDGRIKVEMGGKVPANAPSKAFQIEVHDISNENGSYTPENANATLSHLSDPTEKTGEGAVAESGDVEEKVDPTSPMDHGGKSYENDYEGGCWVRSEDIVDLPLCRSDQWMKWDTSNGEVDQANRHGRAEVWSYDFFVEESDWKIDDYYFRDVDGSGTDADSEWVTDYINWTWRDDNKSTRAYHQCWVSGNADGTMDWLTSHWHEGEDSGTLRVDAGYHRKYE